MYHLRLFQLKEIFNCEGMGHGSGDNSIEERCDWAEWVAWILAVGGGALIAFVLVWVLLTASEGKLDTHLKLPLIVVVSVIVLLIVVSLVTFTYSVLGLANPKKALGLPNGSVRAIIALMLLAVFAVVSIFLYDSLAKGGELQVIHGVQEDQLSQLRLQSSVVLIQPEATPNTAKADGTPAAPKPDAASGAAKADATPATPKPDAASGAAKADATPAAPKPDAASGTGKTDAVANKGTFTVYYRHANPASEDLAKQLIVLLGTLVTAVSSFYFGSNAVASAHAAALDFARPPEPSAGPKLLSINPNQVTADGNPKPLTITGSNLGKTTKLYLEKDGHRIPADTVKVADTTITAQITILTGAPKGPWDVVVDDGTKPTTIAQIEIK